ncbi:hydrolase [Nostoc sp. 3335mG]|nr:hydrolase [Nostoc sp. 3335mG]
MIDAHVHLWQLGRNDCVWPTADEPAIHRDFELAELLETLDAAGVAQAVLVQSQESARDTDWLLDLARIADRIAGVVGWADLRDAASVAERAADRLLIGLRPMVQGRATDWYDDPTLDAGFAAMAEHGLVLDALIRPAHLPSLARLAARHSTLPIVIDHAAKPDALEPWRAAMAPLAEHANVHVKLSGLLNEVPEEAVSEIVETLLAAFGAERLVWGSDWPVLVQVGTYGGWLDMARGLIPANDHAAVFGGNAARLYGLEAARG